MFWCDVRDRELGNLTIDVSFSQESYFFKGDRVVELKTDELINRVIFNGDRNLKIQNAITKFSKMQPKI